MMLKISIAIEKACNKLGIEYLSPHHKKITERREDAQKLADIYVELKNIISRLTDLENKYPEIKEAIDIDINDLDKIDHDLIIEARKIMRNKNKLDKCK